MRVPFSAADDPVSIHEIIDRATPWVWDSYNFQNQMLNVVIGMVLIVVIPLLTLLFIAAQFSLRDVAYYSILVPADKAE
jgi:hypothetical protein